ncbi:MAG: UbiA family prenyltransferase [Flavisolibacter sp.]
MLKRSTIQLLRFHFSLFLLPVYLFALSQVPVINAKKAVMLFFVLHALVYPSSNGYNSFMDKDETPIGGLSKPMLPTRELYLLSVIMDFIAVLISLYIDTLLAMGILLYIAASRCYSYRGIRLKKYPFSGFIIVFFFQGAFIFFLTFYSIQSGPKLPVPLIPCLISSLLIGSLYPLTQIYQHKEDKEDGVTTLSYFLGKKGTFVFSLVLFLSATILLFFRFNLQGHNNYFIYYLLIMLPVVIYFLKWMRQVWKNAEEASFSNSLRMNILSTACTTLFFTILIILNH